MEPKPKAMDEFSTQVIGGRKYWRTEGRAGDVNFRDQETGESLDDVHAHRRAKEEAEAKGKEAIALAAEKAKFDKAEADAKAIADAAVEKQKAEAAAIVKKQVADNKMIELKMKMFTEAMKPDPVSGKSPDEGEVMGRVEKAFERFKPGGLQGGTTQQTGGILDNLLSGFRSMADSQVVRVSTPQEAANLPPGTRFVTPDGRIKVRP